MSPLTDSAGPAVRAVWDQVVAQLDNTTAEVKIPAEIVYALNKDEQLLIKREVSGIFGHPVDFYLDIRCKKRVYLANLASINTHWQCEANVVPGYLLPILTPRTIHYPQLITAPSYDTAQNPNSPLHAPQSPSVSAPPNKRKGLKRTRMSEIPDKGSKSGSESTTGRQKRNKLDLNSPDASTLIQQNGICASEHPETWNEDISKIHDMKPQAEIATPQDQRGVTNIQLTTRMPQDTNDRCFESHETNSPCTPFFASEFFEQHGAYNTTEGLVQNESPKPQCIKTYQPNLLSIGCPTRSSIHDTLENTRENQEVPPQYDTAVQAFASSPQNSEGLLVQGLNGNNKLDESFQLPKAPGFSTQTPTPLLEEEAPPAQHEPEVGGELFSDPYGGQMEEDIWEFIDFGSK
ncbi:hypothetical protein GQX73_g1864 [Xylaria multiplex]|uniref:Uncharacterized protein n=1 Tax=Xylaria multiplex TaxID=323545 RepID=A0A7C8MZ61_9PEZI|nr:hypothetical protein GQX73_g1864 [Xylaria multiplex]